MKRLIGLIIIFLTSFALLFTFEIDAFKNQIINFMPFFENIYSNIDNILGYFKNFFPDNFLNSIPHWFCDLIIYLIGFIIFSIVWYLLFGIIILIRKSIRKRKLNKALNGDVITLSDEEKSRFEWKLYQNRFPGWRLFFAFIELGLFALFIIIRLDRIFTVENAITFNDVTYFSEIIDKHASDNIACLDLYSKVAGRLGTIGYFISRIVAKYIQVMNMIVDTVKFKQIEWIILAVGIILIIVIFWAIGSIFAKPYRKARAKKRAKKCKAKYINKLENIELKAWKKGEKENRISEKNKTLFNNENDISELENNVEAIANDNKPINEFKNNENNQTPEQNYIDDISTGVTDLGVVHEEDNELQEPLFTRQVHFVGDEEHDILLEEEPIIETIEEEEDYYNEKDDNEEISFEKYQPDYMTSLDIEDKVKKYNIDVIEENSSPLPYQEENTAPINDFDNSNYMQEDKVEPQIIEDKKEIKLIAPIKEEIEIKEVKKEEIKPLKVQQKNNINKNIKPINVNEDRKKVVDYILGTSNNSLALSNEEKDKIAIKKPIKPVKALEHKQDKEIEEKKIVKPLKPKIDKTKIKKNIKPINEGIKK